MALKLKLGDSIKWSISYKQSDGITPVNLTGYIIDIDASNKATGDVLFNVVSDSPTTNAYIDVTDAINGNFVLIIKDTSSYTVGTYLIDIEYTDVEGFKQSSKSFELKIQERL